ncbi:MAG TPA: hypothetical protein VNO21_06520 [Polyangiaceae bacterium]|nr:hypothetical protein [Polyangiaceae bacterium]
MDADSIALFVVLPRAELMEQVKSRGDGVVQDEKGVPTLFASRRIFANDDSTNGVDDASDDGGRLGDADDFRLRSLVWARFLKTKKRIEGELLPSPHRSRVPRCTNQEHGLTLTVELCQRCMAVRCSGVKDHAQLARTRVHAHCTDESSRDGGE